MDREKSQNQETEGIKLCFNEIQLFPQIVDLEKFVKSEIQDVSFSNEKIETSSSKIKFEENDQAEPTATTSRNPNSQKRGKGKIRIMNSLTTDASDCR